MNATCSWRYAPAAAALSATDTLFTVIYHRRQLALEVTQWGIENEITSAIAIMISL